MKPQVCACVRVCVRVCVCVCSRVVVFIISNSTVTEYNAVVYQNGVALLYNLLNVMVYHNKFILIRIIIIYIGVLCIYDTQCPSWIHLQTF